MTTYGTFQMTEKQDAILRTILRGNGDGTWIDLDQILMKLPYKTTKQSLQFSLRALVKHGLIEKKGSEKRRSRVRVLYGLTGLGYKMMQGYAQKVV